jgi:hypothetical protein
MPRLVFCTDLSLASAFAVALAARTSLGSRRKIRQNILV